MVWLVRAGVISSPNGNKIPFAIVRLWQTDCYTKRFTETLHMPSNQTIPINLNMPGFQFLFPDLLFHTRCQQGMGVPLCGMIFCDKARGGSTHL
jgi:hypothetical protein